ncbi:guanylate-binding protein 1-like isoform X2 [Microtus pennsylvanicus]
MGAINQQALDQLHYVTELTDRIRTRSSSDQHEVDVSDEFVSFFPDFVWTLMDFTLELKVDGKPASPDEYLEHSLRPIYGTCQRNKEKELNLPRLCIQRLFPKKKCFVFERPANGRQLGKLESLQDEDFDPDFVEQVTEFCSYVFSCSKVKMLSGGIRVNGPRLESLVITYVNAISSESQLCMENAVLALSQTENTAAVQKAIAHYDEQMSQKLQLPTETLQELTGVHRASEKEAIKIFMQNSFKDINQVFLTQLETILEKKLEEFLKKNVQESVDRCVTLLQDIFSPLEEDVKQGIYYKPGGYRLFIKKIQELKKMYYEEPQKGIQAEDVLRNFLQSKEEVGDAILQADQTLTEKEKEIEVEHVRAEASKAVAKMQEEMKQEYEQLLQKKEKSHEEYMKQLNKKIEKEHTEIREMQQKYEQLLQQKEKSREKELKQLTEKLEKEQAETRELQQRNEKLLQQKEKSREKELKQLTEKLEKEQAETRELQQRNEKLLQQKEKSHEELMKQLAEILGKREAQMREKQQKQEQLLQEKEKSHEKEMKHLTKKTEKEKAELREKQQKQEQLLQEKEESHEKVLKELTEKMEKEKSELKEKLQKYEQLLQEKEKSHEKELTELTENFKKEQAKMRETYQKKEQFLLQQKEKSNEEFMKHILEMLANRKVHMLEEQMKAKYADLWEKYKRLQNEKQNKCVIS